MVISWSTTVSSVSKGMRGTEDDDDDTEDTEGPSRVPADGGAGLGVRSTERKESKSRAVLGRKKVSREPCLQP